MKRLGSIQTALAGLDPATAPTFTLNGLKREELIAWNSMILHEIYFAGLGPVAAGPGARLGAALEKDIGSGGGWAAQFSAMGKALGGGSGWAVLTYSHRDGRLMNQWAADHTTTLANGRHILALDMSEHSYHMDYGANDGGYVDVFMQAIRWDNVSGLFDRYSRAG